MPKGTHYSSMPKLPLSFTDMPGVRKIFNTPESNSQPATNNKPLPTHKRFRTASFVLKTYCPGRPRASTTKLTKSYQVHPPKRNKLK